MSITVVRSTNWSLNGKNILPMRVVCLSIDILFERGRAALSRTVHHHVAWRLAAWSLWGDGHSRPAQLGRRAGEERRGEKRVVVVLHSVVSGLTVS